MTPNMLQRAHDLVARIGPGHVVGAEVGVWRGQFSELLLRLHGRLTLFMVDRWNTKEQQPRHNRTQESLRREAERRTSIAPGRRLIVQMDSVAAAAERVDGSLDFVFIDADHTYEGCKRDIEAWLPKIRPGGLLGGHDYWPPFTKERGYGVCQAVDEAVAANGWTLELGPDTTWYVRLPRPG